MQISIRDHYNGPMYQNPETPIEQQIPQVQEQALPQQHQPSRSTIYLIVLSILLLVTTATAGYFYYQNKQLQSSPTIVEINQPSEVSEKDIEPADPITNWKSYINTNLGFSFSYPKEMILEDKLQTSTDPSAWTTKKSLLLSNPDNKCLFTIMINPDGFGPHFPNQTNTLVYKDGNGFSITDTKDNQENVDPNSYSVIYGNTDSPITTNIHGIWSNVVCPNSPIAKTYADETYSQIFATFKFTSPTTVGVWQTVKLKNQVSTISTPASWQVIDNSVQTDLNQDGNLTWLQKVQVKNGDYQIASENPGNWGPHGCYFPDSKEYADEIVYGDKYASYIEFASEKATCRRTQANTQSIQGKITWGVCCKTSGNDFSNLAGFGGVSYESPANYEEEILRTMDQIVLTINL